MIQIRWECLSFCVGYVPRGRGDDAQSTLPTTQFPAENGQSRCQEEEVPFQVSLNLVWDVLCYCQGEREIYVFLFLFKSLKISLSASLGEKEHDLTWLDWQWISDMLLNPGWWMKVCHILYFHEWNIQNGSKLDRKCWSYVGHESLRYSKWLIYFGQIKNKWKTQIKNVFNMTYQSKAHV